jgi:hypothetical protein
MREDDRAEFLRSTLRCPDHGFQVRLLLDQEMRNALGHSRDIAGETIADRAKNTEGYIAIPAFHTSQIASIQSAFGCETLLAQSQKLPRPPDTASEP